MVGGGGGGGEELGESAVEVVGRELGVAGMGEGEELDDGGGVGD